MHLLNIENCRVFRGPNVVFDQLNLHIDIDANTAIIGPNGAGKSTLMKLLARELYPQKGTVEIFGQSRWNVWDLRRKLGLVSADLQKNYAPIAVGRAVVLSGFYSSSDIFDHQHFESEQLETATRVAEEIGISHLANKPYSQMSTGEQRRHLLARSLVNQPEVLVLDEPTTGLDIPARFQYLETIRGLIKAGKTTVFVTHHIDEIPPEITKVALLKNGQVFFHGDKADALTDAKLSELFGCGVHVVEANGFFHVVPQAR